MKDPFGPSLSECREMVDVVLEIAMAEFNIPLRQAKEWVAAARIFDKAPIDMICAGDTDVVVNYIKSIASGYAG